MGVTLYRAKQRRQYPTIRNFLEEIERFDWFTKRQARLYFYGSDERDNGRMERLLQRLADSGRIQKERPFGNLPAYYSCRRINRKEYDHSYGHIYHGVGCTEGFIRLWKTDPHPKIFHPEYKFVHQKPEFAITYSTGKTLYYEFSTADNLRVLKTKIEKYTQILPSKCVALFVLDTDQDHLLSLIDRYQPDGRFYFIDYQTFKSVPLHLQLISKIYYTHRGLEALRDV